MPKSLRERLHQGALRLERLFKADIRYLIRGNFWLLAARFISVGFGIALSIAFANLLTPDTYGVYKYVLSIAGITSAFSLSGLGAALTNAIARGDLGTLRTTFWSSIRWSLLSSAITVGVAGYYAIHSNMTLALSLLIIAVCNPLLSTAGNYRTIFAGLPDFRAGALWSIPRSVIPTMIMIAAVFFTKNPVYIIGLYYVSNTLMVAWLYRKAVHTWRIPKTAQSTDSTMRFARYTSVLSFFSQVTAQVDQFLVWHFVGAAGVAYYSFATSPIEQIQSVTGNITALVTPKFAKKDSDEAVHATLPLRMLQMLAVLLPIMLAYIIAAPFVYKYFFSNYVSVVFLSQIYAVVMLFQPAGLVDTAFIARENVGARNVFIALGQFIKIVLLFIGISHWGIPGGVGALIASEAINALVGLGILLYLRKTSTL